MLRTSLLQWEGISSAREKEKRSEKKLNLYICGLLFNQSSRHMSINGFYRFAIKRHAPENIEQPNKTYTNRPKHCKSITSWQHRAPVTIDLCVRLVLHLQGVEGRTEEGESEHSNCTTCWRQSNTALTECDGVCVCVWGGEEIERVRFYLENHLLLNEVIPPLAWVALGPLRLSGVSSPCNIWVVVTVFGSFDAPWIIQRCANKHCGNSMAVHIMRPHVCI